jgi:hypothetical protein
MMNKEGSLLLGGKKIDGYCYTEILRWINGRIIQRKAIETQSLRICGVITKGIALLGFGGGILY